jgi:hypothetical protein
MLEFAVVSVEAVLKIKTAFGSPCASSVNVPVIVNSPSAELYTPGNFVVPPSSDATVEIGVCPAALRYAAVSASFADVNNVGLLTEPAGPVPSTAYIVPMTSVPVKPVYELPGLGLNPTSPVIAVLPVSVIALPAKTAKLFAVPRSIVVAARTVDVVHKKVGTSIENNKTDEKPLRRKNNFVFIYRSVFIYLKYS